jgi:PAS domain S-box-containing protein
MKQLLTRCFKSLPRQKGTLPFLVGLGTLLLTLSVKHQINMQERQQLEQQIAGVAVNTREAMNSEMQSRINALTRMQRRWEIQGGTPRAVWEADASNYVIDYPGLVVLQWVDAAYQIRWIVPVSARSEAAQALLQEPKRRRALLEAERRQEITLTRTLNLVEGGKGFQVYVPLLLELPADAPSSSESAAERASGSIARVPNRRFDGFLVGVFESRSLLESFIEKEIPEGYNVQVFDGADSAYHRYASAPVSPVLTQLGHETVLDFFGAAWRIRIEPTQALANKHQASPLIGLGGVLTAVVLGTTMHLAQAAQRRTRQVEQANQDLAREVAERQRAESALRDYAHEFQDLYDNAPCGYHSIDAEGTFVKINQTELNWLGYTWDEVIGKKKFKDLLTPESIAIDEVWFPRFKQQGSVRDVEFNLVRKDGSILPVMLNAIAVRAEDGSFLMSRSTISDMTERKQADAKRRETEEALRWQELLLRSMSNASPLAFYVVDERTDEVLYFNNRFCELWGIDCLSGPPKAGCQDCPPLSVKSPLLTQICPQLESESEREVLDDEILLEDGRVIRRFSAQVRDQSDIYFGRLYVFEDITDRKATEAEIRHLNRALESAVVGISQIDSEGRYLKVNPAYAEMGGYLPEELVGMDWRQTVYPDDHEKIIAAYELMLAHHRAEVEVRAVRKDGSMFDQKMVLVKAFDEHWQTRGHYAFMKDISDRREIERMKDEFVSIVSHELRTPLTSIAGALDLLASGVLQRQPEEAQRMLTIAANNTDRLVRMINDILDMERIESGKITMTRQVCDAADLINQSVAVMQDLAAKAGVRLIVAARSIRLCADPDRLIQVLTNLLSNAIKFSPPGSTIWIATECLLPGAPIRQGRDHASTPLLQITVRDQGRGIPADMLEAIFEPFQQVDASDSRQKGGTGLGLSICRSILQQHDGTIWAESTLGGGSTFYLHLPMLWQSETTPLSSERIPRILVCDDDAAMRAVVRSLLKAERYSVITTEFGQAAVEQAMTHQPDVILLNLKISELSGWDTLALLKQQPETQFIPVVLLSGLLPELAAVGSAGDINGSVNSSNQQILNQALERVLSRQNRSARVLIVEDDHDLAQVLTIMFQRHKIEVFHALTALEAIRLSQSLLPDLFVLDLGLPEADGFTVVEWLRQQNHLRHVPLVVYTAQDLDAEERDRLQLGQTLFLTKGRIAPQEFEQRVVNLLNCMVRT